MKNKTTRESIIKIISTVLDLNKQGLENLMNEIDYELQAEWTSQKHVEIIVAIEDHFDIEIEARDIPRLNNLTNIVEYIEKSLNQDSHEH